MASRLDRLLCELRERVRVVYCEMPILFEGEFGHAVVAKGDLQKLTALVGAFLGVCSIHGIRFKPILVNEWKGQMPKPVVNRRIRAILGVDTKAYKRDEWDAVGVGLFAKGFFDGA